MNTEDPTLHEARARSAECPHCGGTGLAILYDRRYMGVPVVWRPIRSHDGSIHEEQSVMRCATFCLCPLGAWSRARCDADVQARSPDLAAVPEGRTRWTTDDPTA